MVELLAQNEIARISLLVLLFAAVATGATLPLIVTAHLAFGLDWSPWQPAVQRNTA